MTIDNKVDYKKAEEDISAYWESLQSVENPNGLWYLEVGDVHNLMDMACDEITRLRAVAESWERLANHGAKRL